MEEKPGIFVQCKEFRVQSYFVPPAEHKDISIEIDDYIEMAKNPDKNFQTRKKGLSRN